MKQLQENIKTFIDERLNNNFMRLVKSKKYSEKRKNYNECIEELGKNFSEEIFEEFRDIQNQLFYQELQEAYKLGFRDSINVFFI